MTQSIYGRAERQYHTTVTGEDERTRSPRVSAGFLAMMGLIF